MSPFLHVGDDQHFGVAGVVERAVGRGHAAPAREMARARARRSRPASRRRRASVALVSIAVRRFEHGLGERLHRIEEVAVDADVELARVSTRSTASQSTNSGSAAPPSRSSSASHAASVSIAPARASGARLRSAREPGRRASRAHPRAAPRAARRACISGWRIAASALAACWASSTKLPSSCAPRSRCRSRLPGRRLLARVGQPSAPRRAAPRLGPSGMPSASRWSQPSPGQRSAASRAAAIALGPGLVVARDVGEPRGEAAAAPFEPRSGPTIQRRSSIASRPVSAAAKGRIRRLEHVMAFVEHDPRRALCVSRPRAALTITSAWLAITRSACARSRARRAR